MEDYEFTPELLEFLEASLGGDNLRWEDDTTESSPSTRKRKYAKKGGPTWLQPYEKVFVLSKPEGTPNSLQNAENEPVLQTATISAENITNMHTAMIDRRMHQKLAFPCQDAVTEQLKAQLTNHYQTLKQELDEEREKLLTLKSELKTLLEDSLWRKAELITILTNTQSSTHEFVKLLDDAKQYLRDMGKEITHKIKQDRISLQEERREIIGEITTQASRHKTDMAKFTLSQGRIINRFINARLAYPKPGGIMANST